MKTDCSDMVNVLAKNVISLTDLMFRWRNNPTYHILRAIRSWSLRLYFVDDTFDSNFNSKKFRLRHYHLTGEQFSFCIREYNKIVFLLADVKKIEADSGFSVFLKRPCGEGKFEFCSIENVCHLAPQLLFVLLCYSHEKCVYRLSVNEMLHSDSVESKYVVFNLTESAPARADWFIDHHKLWFKSHLPTPTENNRPMKNNNTYKMIKGFIKDKYDKGLFDTRILLDLIYEYVPLLNNQQLGTILPAKLGVPIQSASKEKRGYRLRQRLASNNSSLGRPKSNEKK